MSDLTPADFPEQPPEPAPPPPRRYFTPWTTALFAVLTALLIGVFYYNWEDPLASLQQPEASLERLVSRELDFREALYRAPRWERQLYELVGSEPESLDDAIARYDELSEAADSDTVELARAILMGEAGRLERGAGVDERLQALKPDGEQMAEWVHAAYLDAAPDAATAAALLEEIRGELKRGWFTDTLVRRIATRAGLSAEGAQAAAAIRGRGHVLLVRVRMLTGAGLVIVLLAGVILWRAARRPGGARVADAPLPPPWPAADGWGLFARGAFGYLVIPVGGAFLLPSGLAVFDVLAVAAGLPALWWIWRCFRFHGLAMPSVFGLRPAPGGARRVVSMGIVLLALSLLGETALYLILTATGVSSHWADGFLETLLWGKPAAVAMETVDTVVWAPLFEELIFRGLLYPTVRLALPMWPAALASGAIFAGAHGYGLIGFAAVAWSGTIWAVGYERTGSLLPGIVAHALSNLMSTMSFVVLLRW
jgi:membrane protease YdiL (CAAX protease family)